MFGMNIKKIKCHFFQIFIFVVIFFGVFSCSTVPEERRPAPFSPVFLPFLRMEQAGECYYIDDFLPTPDRMVTGKSMGLHLRYYTYWNARYKYWTDVGIMLSFYSKDMRCWSLFEEYVLPRVGD